eukprot:141035-Chlamydomonas_euryale.AAC.3
MSYMMTAPGGMLRQGASLHASSVRLARLPSSPFLKAGRSNLGHPICWYACRCRHSLFATQLNLFELSMCTRAAWEAVAMR